MENNKLEELKEKKQVLKEEMNNASNEEEFINAFRKWENVKKEIKNCKKSNKKSSKAGTIVTIAATTLLTISGGVAGFKLAPKLFGKNKDNSSNNMTTESINKASTSEDRVKDTTGVSTEQIEELLNSSETTTNTSATTSTSTKNTSDSSSSTSNPNNASTTETYIIDNDDTTEYEEPTTSERTEIIPEDTTEPSTESSTESTESTEKPKDDSSTTETIIYIEEIEEPNTEYPDDMPIEEDEDDVIYYDLDGNEISKAYSLRLHM